MDTLQRALSWLLWPVLIAGGMLSVQLVVRRGLPPLFALGVLQVAVVLLIALLERWMPEHASWNIARGDVRTDALHTVCSGILITALVRGLVFAWAPSLGLWPVGLPVIAQLGLAMLISDLGGYVTHVLTHRVTWLWPIHAPHHASLRLYWLNASRMHPLDTASTTLCSLAPLALLGAPASVLVLFDSFAIVHLMLQHSNIRLRHGVLNHLIATAEFHRWHHSSERAGGESNYASFLSLWDHLLGTFRMPRAPQHADEVGLYDASVVPSGWLDQVRHPFRAWMG
jgi:sterol desaturase/sphingolipid hydroxylase (fatty acid hydroxylase superfamily)